MYLFWKLNGFEAERLLYEVGVMNTYIIQF